MKAQSRALLWLVASAVMFGAMAFTAKLSSARLSGPQVAMIRFAVGLLPFALVPRIRRTALAYERLDLLLIRGFFGGIAVLFYFICIQHTNVGVAALLNYTAPIYSGLFSIWFIGERFSAKVLIPLPIALLGVFLVVHAHARPGEVLGFRRWEMMGALSAVCSGIAVTAIRAARRAESSWSIYGSFCLIGLLVTMPQGLSTWRNPSLDEWYALGAMSLLAIGAQLTMTFSLRWVDAMTVGVISQLAVLVSMILGALFINEPITTMAAIGAALSIGGVVGVTFVQTGLAPNPDLQPG
ncbi:MAG TPA: DMT family transporter [Thermoanaerobaculia bacterium]|nr:DMT family transporter [Thermoanaerobaculia bacterium]